jgi:hypothetical protein
MVRVLILAGLFGAASVHAQLQLSPSATEYEFDGARFKALAFPNGGITAIYQPPNGWEYFGGGDQLTLRPRGKAQAQATITRQPLQQPAAFNDATVQQLAAQSLASAPQGSDGVHLISQAKNSVPVSGKETAGMILSYQLSGQSFTRSILFLNRGKEQLRFQFTAKSEDFQDLNKVFEDSLRTWRNL